MTTLKLASRFVSLAVATAALSMALLPSSALAGSPGYVDGSFVTEYAKEDGTFVEVSLDKQLLSLLTGPAGAYDEAAGELAAGLESVRAIVIEVRDELKDDILDDVRGLQARLASDGWQSVARVRDGQDDVFVMLKTDGDVLVGVTVLVSSGSELVFTNVAGRIDMEQLAQLAESYDIPGLDALPKSE